MANYYTHGSFIIPLTSEQVEFGLSLIECVCDKKLDLLNNYKRKAASKYEESVYKLAKKLARRLYLYGCEEFQFSFDVEETNEGLCLYSFESFNTEQAATFTHLLLKHFDLNHIVAIEAAHSCSRPRSDGFGGHAAVVSKLGVKWMSTYDWVKKQKKRLERKVA